MTYTLGYDAENRLVTVSSAEMNAQFTYDGNGARVKSVINNETILFVGTHYELNQTTGEVSKYYFSGAQRIAVRKYIVPESMTLNYFLSDHLGSTSITTDAAGAKVYEQKYKPWGETRYSTPSVEALTKYQFTGQYNYEPEIGLQFYNARFYDSTLGRFISADSIIPTSQGLQAWDRYAYVNNSPVNYTDPTGHQRVNDGDGPSPTSGGCGGLGQQSCQGISGGKDSEPPICSSRACDPEVAIAWVNIGSCAQSIVITSDCLPPISPVQSNSYDYNQIGDFINNYWSALHYSDFLATQLLKTPYPPYKWVSMFGFTPFLEGGIAAVAQVIMDLNNTLSVNQRIGRAVFAFGEAAAIDFMSAPISAASAVSGGMLGGTADGPLPIGDAAGAIVGYGVGQLASNTILYNASNQTWKPYIYDQYNLYDPNGY